MKRRRGIGVLFARRGGGPERVRVEDVVQTLLVSYPHAEDLTFSRLERMAYLTAWRLALAESDVQIGMDWILGELGPRSAQMDRVRHAGAVMDTQATRRTPFGTPRTVCVPRTGTLPALPEEVATQIAFVIGVARRLRRHELAGLVAGTYPVRTSQIGERMDLAALAVAYRDQERAVISTGDAAAGM